MVGHRQLLLFSCIIWTLSSADLFGGLPDVKLSGIYPPLPADLDVEVHDQNDVQLIVSNTGQVGLDLFTGNGVGFYPIGTNNNYIFGTGLWIGGIADVDGNGEIDTVFTQGYNPMAGDSEFREGRIGQSQSDPLARLFDSTDPLDYLEWPPEFRYFDPGVGDTIPLVYSTQDMVTIYTTFDKDPVFGIGSLPLEVHQRTMAFRGPDIGQVIYAIFDITNASDLTPEGPYTIEDAWMGYDSDTDVGVAFADDLASVLFDRVNGADTLVLDIGITWDSDFDETNFTGQPGFAGIAMIQTPGNPYDRIDNDGDGTFTDQSEFASIVRRGSCIIPTDLVRDGYLDLYNGNLYRNEGYPLEIGRNWLGVELEGVLKHDHG